MAEHNPNAPRVLVGAVTHVKSRTLEEIAKAVCDEVTGAGFTLVRSVTVQAEEPVIQQLISHVSNDNEADAIILLGGAGFGPRDFTCEAVEKQVERRIEGFAEAYRHLLRAEMEFGPHTWLVRATAGVYNQCLVFAMTGRLVDAKRAMQALIVPTLHEAVQVATGKLRAMSVKA
jgi:molybdenum cofactor biosynthesis protein B